MVDGAGKGFDYNSVVDHILLVFQIQAKAQGLNFFDMFVLLISPFVHSLHITQY